MDNQIIFEDRFGEPMVMPSKIVVCDACNGEGRQDHPAFENGITSSEWAEMDEDAQQSYLRGDYDVPCECCKGMRVLRVVDNEALNFAQRRAYVLHRQRERALAAVRAEQRAERRMGC